MNNDYILANRSYNLNIPGIIMKIVDCDISESMFFFLNKYVNKTEVCHKQGTMVLLPIVDHHER